MKLFGLEGSGFLISVCLTLFLAGMIMFYVRQALADQSQKMQSIMSIVQQLNANSMHVPMTAGGSGITGHYNPDVVNNFNNKLDTIVEEKELDELSNNGVPNTDEKIDVSDDEEDEEDEEDDEDDEDDDDDDEDDDDDDIQLDDNNEKEEPNTQLNEELNKQEISNVSELVNDTSDTIKEISLEDSILIPEEDKAETITEITLNNNLLDVKDSDSDSDSDDDDNDDDEDDDDDKVKNLTIADDENLDNMLLNMINAHSNSKNLEKKQQELNNNIHVIDLDDTTSEIEKLNNLKVTELRQLVKDKNIKVSNISKLKKSDCIELLR